MNNYGNQFNQQQPNRQQPYSYPQNGQGMPPQNAMYNRPVGTRVIKLSGIVHTLLWAEWLRFSDSFIWFTAFRVLITLMT